MSKYDPLRKFLDLFPINCNEICLSLKQLELVLNRNLPKSAYKYHAWWSDSSTHPNVRAWEDTWKVEIHSKDGRINWVTFIRKK